jgi:hypothetical protein
MRLRIKFVWITGLLLISFGVFFSGCKKQTAQQEQSLSAQKTERPGHLKQTKTFSSEVPIKWLQIVLRVNQVPPGTPGGDPSRMLSYMGGCPV